MDVMSVGYAGRASEAMVGARARAHQRSSTGPQSRVAVAVGGAKKKERKEALL